MNTTLVIACGNQLRGDDGIGPAAADIVTSWRTPGVRVLTVHQLVPELIDEMKHVERVLFIDAAVNAGDSAFESCRIEPRKSRRLLGHHDTPANLLALLRDLEGRMPEAWLVSISTSSFAHGEEITEAAQVYLHAAIVWIRAFLAEPVCTK